MIGKSILAALLLITAPVLAAERPAPVNYILRCVGCHLPDGTGLPSAGIPDFVGKVGAFAGNQDGRAYLLHVPGVLNSGISDHETAELLNYIMDTFAGASVADAAPFTADEVTLLKAQKVGNVVAFRRRIATELAAKGLPVADYPWP
ncbi:MAG: c-type cytochrome [Cypionkella sp.]